MELKNFPNDLSYGNFDEEIGYKSINDSQHYQKFEESLNINNVQLLNSNSDEKEKEKGKKNKTNPNNQKTKLIIYPNSSGFEKKINYYEEQKFKIKKNNQNSHKEKIIPSTPFFLTKQNVNKKNIFNAFFNLKNNSTETLNNKNGKNVIHSSDEILMKNKINNFLGKKTKNDFFI